MKLEQAMGYADLRTFGQKAFQPAVKEKTGMEVAEEIWAEARGRGINGNLGSCKSAAQWKRTWLPSDKFYLVRMPLNAAALTCSPRTGNLVLKKIHAREDSPIVCDYNQNQVGAAVHDGFTPQVIVIDGKHRFQAAVLRGDTHIMAWVGKEATDLLHATSGGGGGPAYAAPATGAKLVAGKSRLEKLRKRIHPDASDASGKGE